MEARQQARCSHRLNLTTKKPWRNASGNLDLRRGRGFLFLLDLKAPPLLFPLGGRHHDFEHAVFERRGSVFGFDALRKRDAAVEAFTLFLVLVLSRPCIRRG